MHQLRVRLFPSNRALETQGKSADRRCPRSRKCRRARASGAVQAATADLQLSLPTAFPGDLDSQSTVSVHKTRTSGCEHEFASGIQDHLKCIVAIDASFPIIHEGDGTHEGITNRRPSRLRFRSLYTTGPEPKIVNTLRKTVNGLCRIANPSVLSDRTLRFSGERNHSTFASSFNNSRAQPSPLEALVELSAARR